MPTLVLHRAGDLLWPIDGARFLAGQIPGARFVLERLQGELPDPADEVLLDSLPISIHGGG